MTTRIPPMTDGIPHQNGSPARVMLIEKHPLFRDGVRACLAKAGGFAICGEIGDAAKAGQLASTLQPNVAVVGIDAPEPEVLDVIEQLCRQPQGPKVIVLMAVEGPPGPTASLFRRGVSAVLSKHVESEELVQAIRNALDGRAYLSSEMIEQLVRRRSRTAGGV